MRLLCFALLTCACSAALPDDNWNQFRGPRGDGTSLAKHLPAEFGEGSPEIVWKTAVPGRAWSSPVVWGDQIWVSNAPEVQNLAEGQDRLEKPLPLSAVCLDLQSGKIIYDIVLFEIDAPQFTHPTNSFGSPTPYIEEGRVYMHFGAYGTACLDTNTGKKLWERTDFPCDHFRGPGSSVAVYGDLLYLTFDGYDYQYLVALDKFTGRTVWKKDRDFDFGNIDGDAKKAYSTPSLFTIGGRSVLVSPFAGATIAYDPKTGDTVWKLMHGGMNAAGRPLAGNGLIYINTADGPNPLIALRPEGTGDVTADIAWKTNKGVPKRPSQVLVNGLMFMMNDSGVATCLDAKSGEQLWSERVGGDYWASPLYANGLIYSFSQSGEIPVFKAAREYELVAQNKLDDGFVASPAVAGESLIVRSKSHLYRIAHPDRISQTGARP
ncbi:MAG: PQQ-binding-like beta-propeller repeat protein [Pirellulales bacterium]